jgi:hypothetical protein
VFCFSVACPALTIYPARAVGCLSGKYGMVCTMGLQERTRVRQHNSGKFKMRKSKIYNFSLNTQSYICAALGWFIIPELQNV